MIRKMIFLFFACFFCFNIYGQDENKVVGHLGEGDNEKPIYLDHVNLGMYLNSAAYLQRGREPWVGSLMDIISWRLMEIEAGSRGVEYSQSELESFLFDNPENARQYSYYAEIFDAKVIKDYFSMRNLFYKMETVVATELLELFNKVPSEEELLNFYIENQKTAFTKPAMYRLAMIELDDPAESDLVEKKLLEGSSFEELAAAHSINFQSALEGGYVGQDLTEASIKSQIPFASNEILSTQPGSWVGPVSVSPSLGKNLFYFFKVLNFEEEEESSFEDEKEVIMDIISRQKAEPLFSEWVGERLVFHNLRFDYSLFNTVKESLGLFENIETVESEDEPIQPEQKSEGN